MLADFEAVAQRSLNGVESRSEAIAAEEARAGTLEEAIEASEKPLRLLELLSESLAFSVYKSMWFEGKS